MLPPKRSSGSRLLPCLHFIVMAIQSFWNPQAITNSRGQRMVDSIIMYQNYGTHTKTRVINLDDKQMVFPEDDDSDIIIVNEDYSKNTIEAGRVEHLREEFEESTEFSNENRLIEASDAAEYLWMTTEWSPCTALCGHTGHQVRGAVCQHKKNNKTTTVETEQCISRGATPPRVLRACFGGECASWRANSWSPVRCLSSGAAVVRRRVECVSANGTDLPDSTCDYSTKPDTTRREPRPCKPAWAAGPWSKCIGPCSGVGRQHRALRCVWRADARDRRGRRKERSAGAACEGLKRPGVSRACRVTGCVNKDGICKDTSRFCENVRAMNMCALKRYKEQCCKTCDD